MRCDENQTANETIHFVPEKFMPPEIHAAGCSNGEHPSAIPDLWLGPLDVNQGPGMSRLVHDTLQANIDVENPASVDDFHRETMGFLHLC